MFGVPNSYLATLDATRMASKRLAVVALAALALLPLAASEPESDWEAVHARAKAHAKTLADAAKSAADKAKQAAEEHGLKDKIAGFEQQLKDKAGVASHHAFAYVSEVKDQVAEQATARLEKSMANVQGMAFSFLKLSDEMVTTLKEMAWNCVQIAVLLVASRYLPTDAMLLVTIVTLLFGPVLIVLFFRLLGALFVLATWAPNVFLLGMVVVLFVTSHIGQSLLRSVGLEPEAIKTVPGFAWLASVLHGCYTRSKRLLSEKAPFVKLDAKLNDIESAVERAHAGERTTEERLTAMEETLNRAFAALSRMEKDNKELANSVLRA